MEQERVIQRVLVACVGEDAAMILPALRKNGVESVAIFLEQWADAPYVDDADFPVLLMGTPDAPPFTDDQKVVGCAMDAAADGFHPGLRRSPPSLKQLVDTLNVAWIGPKAEHLSLGMDPKATRKLAREAGLEVPPQTPVVDNPSSALAAVERMGPPLLEIREGRTLQEYTNIHALRAAASRVRVPTVFERAIAGRRVVVPVMGDGQGGAVALPEIEEGFSVDGMVVVRECPAAGLTAEVRERLINQAGELAHQLSFEGVLSVEFVVTPDGIPWFRSLSPRLPEAWWLSDVVSGVDMVGAELALARGDGLGWDQEEVKVEGHAIHLVLVARESGVLEKLQAPEHSLILRGEGAELLEGDQIAAFRVHAATRHAALVKAQVLLQNLVVEGVVTNREWLCERLADRSVWEGTTR